MNKSIQELTIREFVASLLGYSPRESFSVILPGNDANDEEIRFEGSYFEISSAIRNDPRMDDIVLEIFEENYFDFGLKLDNTAVATYLWSKTQGFDPDLSASVLEDMTDEEYKLLQEIKSTFSNSEEFEQWKKTSMDLYDRAINILERKCAASKERWHRKASQSAKNGDEEQAPDLSKQDLTNKKKHFTVLLEKALKDLGQQYAVKEESGLKRWRYNKTSISLAYLGKKLAAKCELRRIPWDIILKLIKCDCDSSYLKEKASRMKDIKFYPTDHRVIDDVIDKI